MNPALQDPWEGVEYLASAAEPRGIETLPSLAFLSIIRRALPTGQRHAAQLLNDLDLRADAKLAHGERARATSSIPPSNEAYARLPSFNRHANNQTFCARSKRFTYAANLLRTETERIADRENFAVARPS